MQPIAPASPRHLAPGEFINDHDLVVFDDVLNVFLEQAVGTEQLRDIVDALCLRVAMLLALRLFLVLLFLRQTWIEIDFGKFVNQIRQHERVRIIGI